MSSATSCNDLTLTKDNQHHAHVTEADCDVEVEKSRTLNQNDLFTNERIPKRPFSPEKFIILNPISSNEYNSPTRPTIYSITRINSISLTNVSFPKSSSFNDELSNYGNDSFKFAKVTVRDKDLCCFLHQLGHKLYHRFDRHHFGAKFTCKITSLCSASLWLWTILVLLCWELVKPINLI